jgi:hypothetical protein
MILYQKSIKRHQEIGRMQLIADCLAGLAMVAQKVGDYKRSVKLFGMADSLRPKHISMPPADVSLYDPVMSAAKAQLPEGDFEKLFKEGSGMSVEDSSKYALSWNYP